MAATSSGSPRRPTRRGLRRCIPGTVPVRPVVEIRPGTTQLTRTIAQVMPGRPDTPIASVAIGIAQPDAPGVYAERNVAEWEQALRVGAGTYRLRYLNGATVLAEGMFTLTN